MSRLTICLWIVCLLLAFLFSFRGPQNQANSAALSRDKATQTIQTIAQIERHITLTKHARERMRERRLSFADVAEALKLGEVWDEPGLSDQGNWLYKMNYEPPDGSRRIEVVVAIEADRLIVITAMRQGDDQ
jgi:hypothetical protein